MTIAHVLYGLSMGGIETMLVNITHFQVKMGHDIHIVVINDIFDESLVQRIDPAVKLHKIGRKQGSRNPWPVIKMNLCLMRIRPDVIHLHAASISRYILPPWLKSRFCNTLHAMCSTENTTNIANAGPIFAISDAVKSDVHARLNLEATTIRNGINPEIIRQRQGLPPGKHPFRILQTGRLLHEVKGQDILIQAIKTVLDKGYDVELTLMGEGPSEVYLKQLSSHSGISGSVVFLGNKPQEYVFDHLADYDLFVQPSRIEGFGLTVAEAMAAKVPVLVSDNNGPMEIIDNGLYGSFFKSGDADDCARMIISIIEKYPNQDLLDNAQERVLSEFNVRNTASQYVNMYRTLKR